MHVAVVTVSDSTAQGKRRDLSGPALRELSEGRGWQVVAAEVVPDEMEQIEGLLVELAEGRGVDVVLTTGGTGFGPRDVTPEATLNVIEREAPGIAEAIRAESLKKTVHGMLSRGRAGTLGHTLIVNMPGSPKAVKESFEAIAGALPHAVDLLRGGTPH
ncbi:MAG: MogA/MoaB family molybdenum cofactor biosynthesis protein [Actinobacteria bacterium]|nr:MAG: MogA/MoaB family molybdenum cofactor biosynthesis protein [Actinomycetota bacterium]